MTSDPQPERPLPHFEKTPQLKDNELYITPGHRDDLIKAEIFPDPDNNSLTQEFMQQILEETSENPTIKQAVLLNTIQAELNHSLTQLISESQDEVSRDTAATAAESRSARDRRVKALEHQLPIISHLIPQIEIINQQVIHNINANRLKAQRNQPVWNHNKSLFEILSRLATSLQTITSATIRNEANFNAQDLNTVHHFATTADIKNDWLRELQNLAFFGDEQDPQEYTEE